LFLVSGRPVATRIIVFVAPVVHPTIPCISYSYAIFALVKNHSEAAFAFMPIYLRQTH
jgi:hypothetical protein